MMGRRNRVFVDTVSQETDMPSLITNQEQITGCYMDELKKHARQSIRASASSILCMIYLRKHCKVYMKPQMIVKNPA